MNTAALILQFTYKHQPSISTLPIKFEKVSFLKKATGLTKFICEDGLEIKEKIKTAIKSKKPEIIEAYSQLVLLMKKMRLFVNLNLLGQLKLGVKLYGNKICNNFSFEKRSQVTIDSI